MLAASGGDAMRKYVAVAFGAILSFALVLLAIAFVEFQSRKVNSVDDVQRRPGDSSDRRIAQRLGRSWRRIKGGKGPAVLKALMAERIDGARTNLIHTTAIEPPRVVMITSAEPHEGKTTTASNWRPAWPAPGAARCWSTPTFAIAGAHRVFDMPQSSRGCASCCGARPSATR